MPSPLTSLAEAALVEVKPEANVVWSAKFNWRFCGAR